MDLLEIYQVMIFAPRGFKTLARISHRLSSRSGEVGCNCEACDPSTGLGIGREVVHAFGILPAIAEASGVIASNSAAISMGG